MRKAGWAASAGDRDSEGRAEVSAVVERARAPFAPGRDTDLGTVSRTWAPPQAGPGEAEPSRLCSFETSSDALAGGTLAGTGLL